MEDTDPSLPLKGSTTGMRARRASSGPAPAASSAVVSLRWPVCGLVGGMVFVLGGVVWLLVMLLQMDSYGDLQYGVMFDAGSSGTRCHVFRWRESSDGLRANIVSPSAMLKVKPGLSSIATTGNITYARVAAHLDELIAFAKGYVPRRHWYQTPIYLKATAGLRLLPPLQAEQLLDYVDDVFHKSPFDARPDSAKLISGYEEGVLMWVSVNVAAGTIQPDPESGRLGVINPVGALDLGGASTQICFEPEHAMPAPIPAPWNGTVHLREGDFHVYTSSWLYFGANEARYRLFRSLPADPSGPNRFLNPCMPTGYTRVWDNRTISGTSNATHCRQLTTALLNLTAPCDYDQCFMNGVYAPNMTRYASPSGEWYGGDHFNEITSVMGIDNTTTWPEILAASNTLCDLDYTQLVARYGNDAIKDNTCFEGQYISAMLGKGYGFPSDFVFNFPARINGFPTSWALGAMVVEAEFFQKAPLRPLARVTLGEDAYHTVLFLASFCIGVGVFVFACAAFVLHRFQARRAYIAVQ